jgi:cation-dependent mannose-6-phosphate receptor
VLLECTPNAKDSSALFVPKEVTLSDVHLTLYSKLSCLQQINQIEERGFFSTFFLIIFVLLFTYLVLGMLYQYFFVGARGLEMLPNYDFWQKVWISIKLGFIYIKNGCKVIPTDESYDAI